MQQVNVLGFDCPACRQTFRRIAEVAAALGMEIRLGKVDDPRALAEARVLVPTGVVADGRLVFSGGVPNRLASEGRLRESA